MSKTAAELLLEMDAKATKGPWGCVLKVRGGDWPGEFQVEDFASFSFGWDGEEGIYCDNEHDPDAACVLRNALPKLAAVCAAAEKMRANAFGGPCPCESPVCTSLRAFDAALADLTAALSSGGRHARA